MKYLIILLVFINLFAKDVIEKGYYYTLNWTKYTLTCKDESAENQSEFAAKRVAKFTAIRNMLERIKGVNITSKTTIKNLMQNDIVLSTVQGTIRGAKVIKMDYNPQTKKAVAYV